MASKRPTLIARERRRKKSPKWKVFCSFVAEGLYFPDRFPSLSFYRRLKGDANQIFLNPHLPVGLVKEKEKARHNGNKWKLCFFPHDLNQK